MSENLLDDDLIRKEIKLVAASKEKRFINFIIDYFGVIIFVGICYLLLDSMGYTIEPTGETLQERLQGSIFYLTYYLLVEGISGGKSLGKIATKTRVVTLDGHPPEVGNILGRSFSRLVPFEPFSFLGDRPDGWHDRWSKTMVIDETLSVLPQYIGLSSTSLATPGDLEKGEF